MLAILLIILKRLAWMALTLWVVFTISFFIMWAITGMGQPSTMVRLMAFRDSRTLRYSILYLTLYNAVIYIPLIFIFVAARTILPNLASSDDVMPSPAKFPSLAPGADGLYPLTISARTACMTAVSPPAA